MTERVRCGGIDGKRQYFAARRSDRARHGIVPMANGGQQDAPEDPMSISRQPVLADPDTPIRWPRNFVAAMLTAFVRGVQCRERSAQRRALARLDDRLLRDVGLNRTDVAAECSKWFWLR
jgi:uncharacterized protein YjiS (DUF1127 family)